MFESTSASIHGRARTSDRARLPFLAWDRTSCRFFVSRALTFELDLDFAVDEFVSLQDFTQASPFAFGFVSQGFWWLAERQFVIVVGLLGVVVRSHFIHVELDAFPVRVLRRNRPRQLRRSWPSFSSLSSPSPCACSRPPRRAPRSRTRAQMRAIAKLPSRASCPFGHTDWAATPPSPPLPLSLPVNLSLSLPPSQPLSICPSVSSSQSLPLSLPLCRSLTLYRREPWVSLHRTLQRVGVAPDRLPMLSLPHRIVTTTLAVHLSSWDASLARSCSPTGCQRTGRQSRRGRKAAPVARKGRNGEASPEEGPSIDTRGDRFREERE